MTGRGTRGQTGHGEIVKRVLVYGLLLLILATAQCAFFARLELLGAVPNLVLCAVVAIALVDSIRAAAVAGIAGGFLLDALGGVGLSLSPLMFFLVAWLIGSLAAKMMTGMVSYCILLIPTAVFAGAVRLVTLLWAGEPVLGALRHGVLPELICTAVLGLPLYGIVALCNLFWKRERGVMR